MIGSRTREMKVEDEMEPFCGVVSHPKWKYPADNDGSRVEKGFQMVDEVR